MIIGKDYELIFYGELSLILNNLLGESITDVKMETENASPQSVYGFGGRTMNFVPVQSNTTLSLLLIMPDLQRLNVLLDCLYRHGHIEKISVSVFDCYGNIQKRITFYRCIAIESSNESLSFQADHYQIEYV